jgi:hypothetical protein
MYSDTPHSDSAPWESDVALFIDWESLKSSLQRRGLDPEPSLLMETASQFGRLVVAKAYSSWPEARAADAREPALLYDSGIHPVIVPVPPETDPHARRQPQILLKLSTECLENSFLSPHIGTYVLASGSPRFAPLIQSLRSRGYRVVLIGVSWNPPRNSMDRGDETLYYDHLLHREGRSAPPPTPEEPLDDLERVIEDMVDLIREQRRQGRAPLLSWLGHQLRRHISGFNPQSYGFEKFKDLVLYAEEQGALKIVTQGLLDWALLPDEELSEGEELQPDSPPNGALRLIRADASDPASMLPLGAHPVLDAARPLETYREVFEDLVRAADEIEADARYPFVTPGFLGQCLWRKGHWEASSLPPGSAPVSQTMKDLRAGQIRKLVDFAMEQGLLLGSTRFDPETRKSFTTVHLRRSHPFVQSALRSAPSSEAEAGTPGSESGADPAEFSEGPGGGRGDAPQQSAG